METVAWTVSLILYIKGSETGCPGTCNEVTGLKAIVAEIYYHDLANPFWQKWIHDLKPRFKSMLATATAIPVRKTLQCQLAPFIRAY